MLFSLRHQINPDAMLLLFFCPRKKSSQCRCQMFLCRCSPKFLLAVLISLKNAFCVVYGHMMCWRGLVTIAFFVCHESWKNVSSVHATICMCAVDLSAVDNSHASKGIWIFTFQSFCHDQIKTLTNSMFGQKSLCLVLGKISYLTVVF